MPIKRHLCLGKLRLLADLTWPHRSAYDAGAMAFGMSESFVEGLDQIVAECGHVVSLRVALSEAATADTLRFPLR